MNRLAAFLNDERGTVTLDYVIWIPAFCAILIMTVDLSLAFYGYSRMWDVARETGRRAAVGQMTPVEATNYAVGQLPGNTSYYVAVDDSGAESIVVTITAANLSPVFGALDLFSIGDLSAIYTVRREGPVVGTPPLI